MKILVTGTSGYVGKLFLRRAIGDPKIETIYAIDVAQKPQGIDDPKIAWIRANLATDNWQDEIIKNGVPDVIFHFAFWIRSSYGRIKNQEYENSESCRRIIDFCFENGVKRLVYLSSVAAYGARQENVGRLLKEEDYLAEEKYPYGMQKRKVEEILCQAARKKERKTKLFIIRPSSIWGPEAEKKKKVGLMILMKRLLPFLPQVTSHWARQYVYEQDLIDAVTLLGFGQVEGDYEIFNLGAKGIITSKDMACLLGKKTFPLPYFIVKAAFFLGWHLTRGAVPTPAGAEESFTWPINVDGSKINKLGFKYTKDSADIFSGKW